MPADRLITVAIHTYDRAVALKNLLEREGIQAVLHNVNLSNPVVSSGIRVRIAENDLPKALRIIENSDIFASSASSSSQTNTSLILVPVDFSPYSLKATAIAFDIASRHKANIILLHSYVNPAISKPVKLTDTLTFEISESSEVDRRLKEQALAKMNDFIEKLRQLIKNGDLPPVKFTNIISEGVPEDVINETAKTTSPDLIVMGTRDRSRKVDEMVGSVTAEVLDICRYPVFSIPESSTLTQLTQIDEILYFCNLDQEDILALDILYRIFRDLPVNLTIAHVPGKKDRGSNKELDTLSRYCAEHYPTFNLSVESIHPGTAIDDYRRISSRHHISLISLPNKRRNVFTRFFNPSLAHKLLLHADIPMLVIPV